MSTEPIKNPCSRTLELSLDLQSKCGAVSRLALSGHKNTAEDFLAIAKAGLDAQQAACALTDRAMRIEIDRDVVNQQSSAKDVAIREMREQLDVMSAKDAAIRELQEQLSDMSHRRDLADEQTKRVDRKNGELRRELEKSVQLNSEQCDKVRIQALETAYETVAQSLEALHGRLLTHCLDGPPSFKQVADQLRQWAHSPTVESMDMFGRFGCPPIPAVAMATVDGSSWGSGGTLVTSIGSVPADHTIQVDTTTGPSVHLESRRDRNSRLESSEITP